MFKMDCVLLKVEDKSFKGRQGDDVNYKKASLLLESGDVLIVPADVEVFSEFKDKRNIQGNASFNIKSDNKASPKLKLMKFEI